jgi:hypothetical protein
VTATESVHSSTIESIATRHDCNPLAEPWTLTTGEIDDAEMEIVTPSDYETNPKRQRRSLRPCDACRKRKTRCLEDDTRDKCVHCRLRGTPCTFRQGPLRRQLQPHSSRNAEVSTEDRGVMTPGDPPTTSPASAEARTVAQHGSASTSNTQHTATPEVQSFSNTSREQALAPGLDDLNLSSSHPTLGMAQHRFAELYGLGSDMEPILMVCDSII